jgi:hypothetical protein
MPIPVQPLMSFWMLHDPYVLGAEKSPLITMLLVVPTLTSLTLSMLRPYESEMPAPMN